MNRNTQGKPPAKRVAPVKKPLKKPAKKPGKKVNWGGEVASSAGIVGKVFLKILTYIINVLLTILLIGLITGTVVGATFAYYIKNYIEADITDFDIMSSDVSTTTKIFYMDWTDRDRRIGVPVEITEQRLHGVSNQIWASYSDMPSYLWQAFVAIEDKRFPEHSGVDFITTGKAVFAYFLKGANMAGGSTITQQLVKTITGDDDVTPQRKIQEIMRAFKLEEKYDKTEILEMYLNSIYLSQGCTGVGAAAYTYFGKEVKDLTLIECAAIAAITQKPTKWDPIQNPEENQLRRDLILREMADQGYLTESEFEAAHKQELVINYKGRNNHSEEQEVDTSASVNSWYTDAAIDEAIQLLMKNGGYTYEVASKLIYTGGFQILTAMDPFVQETLDEFYENAENFPTVDNSPIQPESSFVIIDPRTGDVLGLRGARGEKTGNRLLNYATKTTRSPGSSIKPLSIYGPALEAGIITYGSITDDTPANFGEPTYGSSGQVTGYTDRDGYPDNYSKNHRGLTTTQYAVTHSLNTIPVKILQKLTIEKSFDFLKNKLQMYSLIDYRELAGGTSITDKNVSALALGGMNYGVTVLEITAAYSAFANNGVYNKPRIVLKILDSQGNVLINNEEESTIVMSEQNASIMTKLLQNVVVSGTANAITVDNIVNVAGKTGTTTADNDRWFIGYTPYYIGGVWFGYAMPSSLNKFSASVSPSVVIWDKVMTILHEKKIKEVTESGYGLSSFVLAQGVTTAVYCVDSGKLMTDACRADYRGNRSEMGYFTANTVPNESCDRHVMVEYDKVTGGIACQNCPPANIVRYGMLKIDDRNFPYNIVIADAQYTWRNLPAGVEPELDETLPFYASMLSNGVYAGISSYGAQFNSYCSVHYNTSQEEETGETEEPENNSETAEEASE